MANLIKIKRSSSTAQPASLAEGELAYSFLSNKLYIGNTTAVWAIGGKDTPGVLTANQALVANATSGIDKVITSNAVITGIWANGAAGVAGQILYANSTGGIYWGAATSGGALSGLSDVTLTSTANNNLLVYNAATTKWENHTISGNTGQVQAVFTSQNVQVSLEATVNVATALNVGANVNLTTTAINVGNSTVNAVVNSTSITVGTSVVNSTVHAAGANVYANVTSIYVGNSLVNTIIGNASVIVGNTTVNATLNSTTLTIGTSVVNSTAVAAGSNSYINVTSHYVGNSLVSTLVGNATIALGNTTVNLNANSTSLVVGTTVVNTSTVTLTGTVNATVSVNSATVTAGANSYMNLTSHYVGNSLVSTLVGNATIALGNTTVNLNANSTSLTIASGIFANTTGVYPTSNTVGTALGDATHRWVVTANTLSAVDVTVTGNLTVSGTLTTIDTNNLTIKDSMIKLANNNTADIVDIGLYGMYTATGTKYAALYRENTTGTFKLYTGLTNEPTTTVDITGGTLGSLSIGSLTLSTALSVGNGGTGATSFTAKGIVYGNTTGPLGVTAAGTDGQVLQANSTGFPVFADLDGGTF